MVDGCVHGKVVRCTYERMGVMDRCMDMEEEMDK